MHVGSTIVAKFCHSPAHASTFRDALVAKFDQPSIMRSLLCDVAKAWASDPAVHSLICVCKLLAHTLAIARSLASPRILSRIEEFLPSRQELPVDDGGKALVCQRLNHIHLRIAARLGVQEVRRQDHGIEMFPQKMPGLLNVVDENRADVGRHERRRGCGIRGVELRHHALDQIRGQEDILEAQGCHALPRLCDDTSGTLAGICQHGRQVSPLRNKAEMEL